MNVEKLLNKFIAVSVANLELICYNNSQSVGFTELSVDINLYMERFL